MARWLHVTGGVCVNVIEYGAVTPPPISERGEDVVPDPTGTTNVGAVVDVAAIRNLAARTQAQTDYAAVTADGKVLRALVAVLLDEINTLRRVATPVLPDRTMAQARTAILNKLSSGSVDA